MARLRTRCLTSSESLRFTCLVVLALQLHEGDAVSASNIKNVMRQSKPLEGPDSERFEEQNSSGKKKLLAAVGASGEIQTMQSLPHSAEGQALSLSVTAQRDKPTPVPKIIWSFWQEESWTHWLSEALSFNGVKTLGNFLNRHSYDYHQVFGSKDPQLPPFLEVCVLTWTKLNPDYDIRLLNFHNMWDWVNKSDLPVKFDDLSIMAHKSDAVRLAVLNKYGGTWMDMSILLLKPLSNMLGPDRTERPFFILKVQRFVENWFLSAPPNDPFLGKVVKCQHEIYSKQNDQHGMETTGMFSARQQQDLCDLNIDCPWKSMGMGYLSSHACFYKTLDEDPEMDEFYNSRVHKYEGYEHAASQMMWKFNDTTTCHNRDQAQLPGISEIEYINSPPWVKNFLYTTCPEMTHYFLDKGLNLLKFSGDSRKDVVAFSKYEILCAKSTLTEILKKIGVIDGEIEDMCGARKSA